MKSEVRKRDFSARKIRSPLVFLIVQQAHRLNLMLVLNLLKKMISLRDKSLLTKRAAKYITCKCSIVTYKTCNFIDRNWILDFLFKPLRANSGLLPASFCDSLFSSSVISPSAVAAAIIVRKINSPASTWLDEFNTSNAFSEMFGWLFCWDFDSFACLVSKIT